MPSGPQPQTRSSLGLDDCAGFIFVVYEHVGAISLPVCAAPLIANMLVYEHLLVSRSPRPTVTEHMNPGPLWMRVFNLLWFELGLRGGILLLSLGLFLLLIPQSPVGSNNSTAWHKGNLIAILVLSSFLYPFPRLGRFVCKEALCAVPHDQQPHRGGRVCSRCARPSSTTRYSPSSSPTICKWLPTSTLARQAALSTPVLPPQYVSRRNTFYK